VTVKSAAIELCLKYQRAKVVARLSDVVSVPVQPFEKSFLFQFVENSRIDKTVRVGGLGAGKFSMPSRIVFTPSVTDWATATSPASKECSAVMLLGESTRPPARAS
jgi:hypothetical protein